MLNKLKKAVKYIVKKVKQGVKFIAKTINDYKCAAAHVAETGINAASEMYKTKCNKEIKKLDTAKSVASKISKIITDSHNRTTTGIIGLCLSAGLVITGVIDSKRMEV